MKDSDRSYDLVNLLTYTPNKESVLEINKELDNKFLIHTVLQQMRTNGVQ